MNNELYKAIENIQRDIDSSIQKLETIIKEQAAEIEKLKTQKDKNESLYTLQDMKKAYEEGYYEEQLYLWDKFIKSLNKDK